MREASQCSLLQPSSMAFHLSYHVFDMPGETPCWDETEQAMHVAIFTDFRSMPAGGIIERRSGRPRHAAANALWMPGFQGVQASRLSAWVETCTQSGCLRPAICQNAKMHVFGPLALVGDAERHCPIQQTGVTGYSAPWRWHERWCGIRGKLQTMSDEN